MVNLWLELPGWAFLYHKYYLKIVEENYFNFLKYCCLTRKQRAFIITVTTDVVCNILVQLKVCKLPQKVSTLTVLQSVNLKLQKIK